MGAVRADKCRWMWQLWNLQVLQPANHPEQPAATTMRCFAQHPRLYTTTPPHTNTPSPLAHTTPPPLANLQREHLVHSAAYHHATCRSEAFYPATSTPHNYPHPRVLSRIHIGTQSVRHTRTTLHTTLYSTGGSAASVQNGTQTALCPASCKGDHGCGTASGTRGRQSLQGPQ